MNRALSILLVFIIGTADTLACVNTRYSREEEKQITGDTLKLIMGQFAHHGEAYYRKQIETTTVEIEADAANVEARNDRAVAWLKLKDYNRAEAEFLAIEKSHPNRYRTHANLGVLYKKIGEFAKAAAHLEKSFKIQPGGHLGLGDYYLRMIRWLDRVEDMRSADEPVNFLNIPYTAGPTATAQNAVVNREFIETLIKSDSRFSDGLVVLGDLLVTEGKLELAYRAYHRAMDLEHPFRDIIKARQRDIWDKWSEDADSRDGHIVLPRHKLYDQLKKESIAAEKWVKDFQWVEAKMIKDGIEVDFAKVKVALPEHQIGEPKYIFSGVVKGTAARLDGRLHRVGFILAGVMFFFALIGMITTAIYLVKWVRRRFATG